LERLYAESIGDERSEAERSREELRREAIVGVLDAIAHIRRAAIDGEQWRYEVEKLKDEAAFKVACYVAALTDMGHPDGERAREILEEIIAERDIEGGSLMRMISWLEGIFDQMREEAAKRGA
jgi:hypothetical protein